MNLAFSILNLKRREDRKQRFEFHHRTNGYNVKNFNWHYGRDGKDYEDKKTMLAALRECYPADNKVEIFGNGSLGYYWSCLELLDAFIAGTPDTEFIYFNQDDRHLHLNSALFERIFNQLAEKDAKFACLKMMWYHETVPKPTFALDSFSFRPGWFGYGDSGLILNRRAAKKIRDESIQQGEFLEYINKGFAGENGYYTNCDVTRKSTNRDMFFGLEMSFDSSTYDDIQDRIELNKGEYF